MRLDSLTLRGFRCFVDATLVFDERVILIVGQNNTGKTTIADAIQFALSGQTRGTDAGGRGAKSLVREGTAGALVELVVDGTSFTRSVSSAGNTQITGQPPRVNPDLLRCLVNGAAFLDLAHADAKDLLLRALDVRVPVDAETLTLAEVDARYQQAYERRRTAKADLAAIRVPVPDGDAGEVLPDLIDLEIHLADLRAEERRLVAEHATQAATKTARAAGRREQIETQLRSATDRLIRAEKKLAEAAYPADAAKHAADLEAEIKHLIEADALSGADKLREDLAEIRGKLKPLADAEAKLSQHEPKRGCVLDPAVPCMTPGSMFTAHWGALKTQIAESLVRQEELERGLAVAAQGANVLTAKRGALRDLTAMLTAKSKDEAAVAEARKVVADVQGQLDACPPAITAPDPMPEVPEIVTVRQRIAHGEEVIRDVRELQRQRDARGLALVCYLEASQRLADLEAQVNLLGPKGARAKALGEAVASFTRAINEALLVFGYELQFCIDPWGVLVNGLSAALLSASERLRVGVALQMALADVTGIGFLIVDGADMLDGANRTLLLGLARAWTGGQVILLATRDDDLEPPAAEGMAVYCLRHDYGLLAPTVVERRRPSGR